MQGLIVQNPYENFILACTLTDNPMATYRDVWEASFDWEIPFKNKSQN